MYVVTHLTGETSTGQIRTVRQGTVLQVLVACVPLGSWLLDRFVRERDEGKTPDNLEGRRQILRASAR